MGQKMRGRRRRPASNRVASRAIYASSGHAGEIVRTSSPPPGLPAQPPAVPRRPPPPHGGADFALQNKLISQTLRDTIQMLYPVCKLALEVCDGIDWRVECLLGVTYCQARARCARCAMG